MMLNCYCSFWDCCRNSSQDSSEAEFQMLIVSTAFPVWPGLGFQLTCRGHLCFGVLKMNASSNVGHLGSWGWWVAKPLAKATVFIFKHSRARTVCHPWAGWSWLLFAPKEKACVPANRELVADVSAEKQERHLEATGCVLCQWTNEEGTHILRFLSWHFVKIM